MMNSSHSTASSTDSRKRTMGRKKICRYCADPKLPPIDYKEPKLLSPFVSERGKIIPRRITGNCAYHQRRLQESIKRARILALLPSTITYQA